MAHHIIKRLRKRIDVGFSTPMVFHQLRQCRGLPVTEHKPVTGDLEPQHPKRW